MGRLREQIEIDNLVNQDYREEFTDLLKRRRPDVVIIGGFSVATTKLWARVKEVLIGKLAEGDPHTSAWRPPETGNEQVFNIPVIYIRDEVARIYQHSKHAAEEFSALSPIAKYCVGLACYAQNPLNEYAALGSDITAISFEDEDQHLVSLSHPYHRHFNQPYTVDTQRETFDCT